MSAMRRADKWVWTGTVWVLVLAALLLPSHAAEAQTAIRQAGGFEAGNPSISFCSGTPDVMPQHGTAVTAATGTTYIGFHESSDNGPTWPEEIFSIAINGGPLSTGSAYAYAFLARIVPINVAHAWWIASSQGANNGSFTIYVGATPCALTQSIGTLAMTWPVDNQWTPREMSFVANGNYQYITFAAQRQPFQNNITYFGIDDTPLTDLAITKTDNSPTYTPGSNVTYTLVATNNGPAYASTVQISDPLPAGITTATWTCAAVGVNAACGAASGTGALNTVANIPVGGTITYTVTMAVPPTMTGTLTNVATIAAPGGGDSNPGNNTAQDVDTAAPRADLAITKVSTPNPYVAGAPFAYTVVVSNLGPSAVTGAQVNDTLPAPINGFGWTCAGAGGGTCPASGIGSLVNVPVDLPVGGTAIFTISGLLPSGFNTPLSNTAVVLPPVGVTDPVISNNTATDINPIGGALADLRITKVSSPNPYVPGQPLTYTIVATNAGPSDAPGAIVEDMWPAPFAGFTWTCTPNGGGAACITGSGTGDIHSVVDLPAGSSATFTATGTVPSGLTGAVTNTASIIPPLTVRDPVPGNNTAQDVNPSTAIADLTITKTQTPDPYVPGQPVVYTLLVVNNGPSDAPNARVQDTPPGVLTNVTWTCAASGAGASCAAPSGTGVIDSFVTLPAGTSATFTMTGDVGAGVNGILSNTATVTPPTGVTDPVPGSNTSTVNSGGAPMAELSIAKTASANPYTPGAPLTYTMIVRNDGPSDALGARVQDLFPPVLSGFTWTCAPSVGAATCALTSGVGQVDTLVDLPAGAVVTFTVTGTVSGDTTGALTNTATVAPPIGVNDPTPSTNTSSVTIGAQAIADLSLTKTSTPNPYVPGLPITYTIVASNVGPSTLQGGRVRDGLPAVLQNVTWTCVAVNGTCPAASGTGNIDALVDIDASGTVTFTITADVPAGTVGTLVNAATIVPPSGTTDPTTPNNTATNYNPSIPLPGPADLQITQEAPGVAPPNGLLTFRLVVKNLGSNPALNPYVTGMIPPGTTFVSSNPGSGGMCTIPGNPAAPDPMTGYPIGGAAVAPLKCTWPGLMQVGESRVVEFTVRVAAGTPTAQILWSCFWTWSDTEDPYHANNVIDSYLFVNDGTSPVGDLSLQGAAMSMGIVGPDGVGTDSTVGTELAVPLGGTVKIRFSSTNAGPVATRGQYALILDQTAISVVDVQVPQGWLAPSGPSSAVWDTGHVQPGQTVTADLTVQLHTTGAIKLFAQRVAGVPGDPDASDERATIVLDGYGPNAAGRWVAVGDIDGFGDGEIITGTGQGETPQVRVYSGMGTDIGLRFFAYERPFLGGVRVASCDVNGDGVDEVITAPGPGRAPTIRVLGVASGQVNELTSFNAFETGFMGGVFVSCADLDGDGRAEIVVGAGPGRAPEVQVYNSGLGSLTLLKTFLAYEPSFQGGVRVAAGTYAGRAGWLDAFGIVTTPGAGRAAELRLFTASGTPIAQAVISAAANGIVPGLGDANGDGKLDVIITPDDGRPELIRIIDVDAGNAIIDVPGGLAGFPVGLRAATGVLTNGGASELVIANAAGGEPKVMVITWTPGGPALRLELKALEIP